MLSICFERPHDYHFQFRGGETAAIFRGCLLVGFTTPIEEAFDVPSVGEAWYDRWLVLRHPDGRLAYVPRDGLMYIEESDRPPPPPADA